jgi:hypothetical protein
MEPTPPHRSLVTRTEILPPGAGSTTAPATLRAYNYVRRAGLVRESPAGVLDL